MDGPRVPQRPTNSQIVPEPDGIPDEPPPAYEPTPAPFQEQTLEYGPLRPFQAVPTSSHISSPPPPRHYSTLTSIVDPSLQNSAPQRRPSRSHRYQQPHQQTIEPDRPYVPPPNANGSLPPPTFPFWNGSSLTPAQTGFQEGPSLAPFGTNPHPQPTRPYASSPPVPRQRPQPTYEPTSTPTPGQPLLHSGQLLVYPANQKNPCPKCHNTGYKPFDEYESGGYKGDDPSHPCRKCWSKFGKPFSSALKISCQPTPPDHYQKPLRLYSTPANGGGGGGVGSGMYGPPSTGRPQIVFTNQRPHVNVMGNTLVVRPGDPRIGGVLCRTCGGDGLMMGPFIFDEVTCTRCLGTGRVF